MELKFVWIKEYKNIKETGFNFNHSSDEEFEFINEEIIIKSKLVKSPINFFEDNISSITAIVGKNGSGKTNLTEFINYNLAHATNGRLTTYIQSKGIVILNNLIFVQEKIFVKNEDLLKLKGYKILRFKNAPLDIEQGEFRWHEMESNKYIYYNPAFDLRAIPVEDNLVNLSTTMLVYNDAYKSEKLYSYAVSDKNLVNQLDAHESMEKSRISDFILRFENAKNYIDFLPENIQISIDTEKINSFLKKKYYYGEELNDENNAKLNKLQDSLDSLESFMIDHYHFEDYFVRQEDNSIVRYYSVPIDEQRKIFFRLLFIKIFQGLVNKKVIFPEDFFRQFLYEEYKNSNKDKFLYKNEILKLKEQILKIINNVDWKEFEFTLHDIKYAEIDYNKNQIYNNLGSLRISLNKNKDLLNKTISLMDEIMENRRVFSLEPLKEFSSGQKYLLTLFSRFFWAKNKISESEIGRHGIVGESIVIFIDEGEVALHPEWQRVFFSKVTSFLSDLFQEKKIQLILTTHSPFVLSDIPKDNVIFLDKNEDGNTVISNLNKENTFGANIYSLLADSFFMENTIGAFAEKKMKIALEILKSKHTDYSDEKKHELKYIIDSIGEPIIKEQFEYLYKKKFEYDEVSALKNRIIQLESQLNKNSNDSNKN